MYEVSVERLGGLTPREARVLKAVCEGKTDRAIADELAISIKTVDCHIGHIYDKLQVRAESINSRCAAIAAAISRGILCVGVKALAVFLIAGSVQQAMTGPARCGVMGGLRPLPAVCRSKSW